VTAPPGGGTNGRVAVTGATGFLGRRLVPALSLAGWRVRVLVRVSPPSGLWGPAGPELVIGDLDNGEALSRLVEGAAVVIHAAGLIKALHRRDFFAVNAAGAERIAHLVPGRMILVSSLAAREPALSDYAASKRAGETAALRVLGPRLTVFRPPAIYGPGDRETLGLFRLAARSPVLPLPGGPGARLALAHVDDVIGVILDLAARESPPPVLTFGGVKPAGYDWREIMTEASRAVGRGSHLVSIPRPILTGAAALSGAWARLSGTPAIFTPGKARELLHEDWSVSANEAVGAFREGAMSLAEGFSSTVAWYRNQGWL